MMIEIGKGSHQNSIESLRDRPAGGAPLRLTSDQDLRTPELSSKWGAQVRMGDGDSARPGSGSPEADELFSLLGVVSGNLRFSVPYIEGLMMYGATREFFPGEKLTFGALIYPYVAGVQLGVHECTSAIGGSSDILGAVDLVPSQWNRAVFHMDNKDGLGMYKPFINGGRYLVALPALVTGHVEAKDWRYFSKVGETIDIQV